MYAKMGHFVFLTLDQLLNKSSVIPKIVAHMQ
jgi:hypothetical protein